MRKMKTIVQMIVSENVKDCPEISTARAVYEELKDIRVTDREHFVVLVLNARRMCVGRQTVSIGTLSASLVHPREVFKPAILMSGAAIVVAHNHPSGDHTPSSEDKDVTRRIQRAGELLGIPLADHVVVSRSGFYSFREHGLL